MWKMKFLSFLILNLTLMSFAFAQVPPQVKTGDFVDLTYEEVLGLSEQRKTEIKNLIAESPDSDLHKIEIYSNAEKTEKLNLLSLLDLRTSSEAEALVKTGIFAVIDQIGIRFVFSEQGIAVNFYDASFKKRLSGTVLGSNDDKTAREQMIEYRQSIQSAVIIAVKKIQKTKSSSVGVIEKISALFISSAHADEDDSVLQKFASYQFSRFMNSTTFLINFVAALFIAVYVGKFANTRVMSRKFKALSAVAVIAVTVLLFDGWRAGIFD